MSSVPTADETPRPAAAVGPAASVAQSCVAGFELAWRLAGVLLALLGWWLSLDLLRVTVGGAPSNPLLATYCGPQADAPVSECLSVLRSEFARVGGGAARGTADAGASFPWAGLGLAYFAFIGLWVLLAGLPRRGALVRSAPLLLVLLLGVWTSVSLVQVMAGVLQRWCLGCVLVHGVNAALVVLVVLALLLRARRAGEPPIALLVAATLAALLGGVGHVLAVNLVLAQRGLAGLERAYTAIVDDASYVRWRYEQQPAQELPLPEDAARSGPEAAPFTIVAFIDFQCPACRLAHAQLEAVSAAYGARVRVVYVHYPQNHACNPAIRAAEHPAACEAARAALAARQIGGNETGVRMIHELYARRHALETGRFGDWAAELGLERAAFEAARGGPLVAARLAEDVALGNRLQITSIPALYVNGRRFEGWRRLPNWAIVLGPSTAEESAAGPPAP
jgi:protein-disulfide isomerase/uncharacterized membrane protein